jgi:hypothetical protein
MELKINKIEVVGDKFRAELRVFDEELDVGFFIDYDQAELEDDKWVEKAKLSFLDIKANQFGKENVIKNFEVEKGLVKHKIIEEKKEEEVVEEKDKEVGE